MNTWSKGGGWVSQRGAATRRTLGCSCRQGGGQQSSERARRCCKAQTHRGRGKTMIGYEMVRNHVDVTSHHIFSKGGNAGTSHRLSAGGHRNVYPIRPHTLQPTSQSMAWHRIAFLNQTANKPRRFFTLWIGAGARTSNVLL